MGTTLVVTATRFVNHYKELLFSTVQQHYLYNSNNQIINNNYQQLSAIEERKNTIILLLDNQYYNKYTVVVIIIIIVIMTSLILLLLIFTIYTASSSKNTNNGSKNAAEAFSNFVRNRKQQFIQQRKIEKEQKAATATTLLNAFRNRISTNNENSTNSWWKDLASKSSPLRILLPDDEDEYFFFSDDEEEDNTTTNSTTTTTSLQDDYDNDAMNASITHFCFLIHGHRGHSKDLSYVQASMKRQAKKYYNSKQRFIIHSVTCNEKKTDDGVIAGGERLIDEIIYTIRKHMNNNNNDNNNIMKNVTISLLGNSLGGLYARYAISLLKQRCLESCNNNNNNQNNDNKSNNNNQNNSNFNYNNNNNYYNNYYILDNKYNIYLNIFCTTATPHLGIAGHTFLPIPRRAEIGVAIALGQSGKDLFRLNTLLKSMATQQKYLLPLSLFTKRIVYANAFGTDFPVPASTAAFLHQSSLYPHHVIETINTQQQNNNNNDTNNNNNNNNIGANSATSNDDDEDGDDIKTLATTTTTTTTEKSTTKQPKKSLVVAKLHTPGVHECEEARGYYNRTKQQQQQKVLHDGGSSSSGSSSDSEDSQNSIIESSSNNGEDYYDNNEDDDELAQMSTSLDALGWKKVFVDMRTEVPRIAIPKAIPKAILRAGGGSTSAGRIGSSSDSNIVSTTSASPVGSEHGMTDEDEDEDIIETSDPVLSSTSKDTNITKHSATKVVGASTTTSSNTNVIEPIHRLKEKNVLSSKDVAAAVLTTALPDEESQFFHWPMGHNMIVAFSRSRFSTYMNKAGRPVVDALAKELVHDIFQFQINDKEDNDDSREITAKKEDSSSDNNGIVINNNNTEKEKTTVTIEQQ